MTSTIDYKTTDEVIEIGISANGKTEILSGLNQGDLIIPPTVEKTSTSSASSSANSSRNNGMGGGF